MPKSTPIPEKDLLNTLDDRILYPWYLEYRGEDSRTFIDKSKEFIFTIKQEDSLLMVLGNGMLT